MHWCKECRENLPTTVGSSSVWRLLAGMIARPRATCSCQHLSVTHHALP